jgi:hypothetical protein
MGRDAEKGKVPKEGKPNREWMSGDSGGVMRSESENAGGGGKRLDEQGTPGIWAAMREADRVEAERVGPFPSWGWVYGTLIVYGILMMGLLSVLTWVLDPGSTP